MAGKSIPGRRGRRREREPLEVRMSLSLNLGSEPGDAVTLMEDRRVPLVGSVFDQRDRILREFLRLLAQAGLRQPRLARRLLPGGKRRK